MVDNRKQYFIDRAVQWAVLSRLALHWALFLLVVGAFLYFVELVVGDPREAGKNLVHRHGPTVLAVLVLAPIFIRDLCKVTNRFAGPVARLHRAMRDLADGRELAPVHFRRADFWNELAADFNRVVERIQSPTSELDKHAVLEATSNYESEVVNA